MWPKTDLRRANCFQVISASDIDSKQPPIQKPPVFNEIKEWIDVLRRNNVTGVDSIKLISSKCQTLKFNLVKKKYKWKYLMITDVKVVEYYF